MKLLPLILGVLVILTFFTCEKDNNYTLDVMVSWSDSTGFISSDGVYLATFDLGWEQGAEDTWVEYEALTPGEDASYSYSDKSTNDVEVYTSKVFWDANGNGQWDTEEMITGEGTGTVTDDKTDVTIEIEAKY